jgi:uncharacterized damage-inducible protein DinB
MVAPVFHSFLQVREELAEYTTGLETEQVWRVLGGTSLGFHLSHIAGSVDRLSTYVAGEPLTDAQLEFLGHEPESGASLGTLLALVEDRLAACEERLRQILPGSLAEARTVGRRELPTTVIGLIVHLAEHTQRHLGQVIVLSKLLRQASAKGMDSALAGSEGTGEVGPVRPPASVLPDSLKS